MSKFEAIHQSRNSKNECPSPDLGRFTQREQPLVKQTYAFQGYPSEGFQRPKQPIRHQPSADVKRDISRYFRKDSPNDDQGRLPSPVKQPPQQQEDKRPTPQLKLEDQKPDWLQDKGQSRLQGNDSPRMENGFNSNREPVIRDMYRDMSSAEVDRKKREFQIAQEDLAEAARRKKERQEERKEDIRKNDHRKQKFTEHQIVKPGSPKYTEPPRPRYEGEMTQRDSPSRLLREQDLKMDRVRNNLDQVRNGYPEDRRDEGVNQQEFALRKLQDDIDQLRDNPQFMRPAGMPTHRDELKREFNPEIRAHSGFKPPVYLYASKPWGLGRLNLLGLFFMKEPPTERYGRQRGRDFYESTNPYGLSKSPQPAGYLNTTPRRPVGRWLNEKSTYNQDFDPPFYRQGRRNLNNPVKGNFEKFDPWSRPGAGAPRVDATGQRTTHIQRSMGILGRESAESANQKKRQNKDLLYTIGEQAAYERLKKQAEKEYMQEGSIELAEHMRGPYMRVGYPGGKPSHHLPHAVSNQYAPAPIAQQRKYHHELENQISERNKQSRLSKLEEERQANLHFVEMDKRFKHDNYGGGAPKGLDYRKVKLDNAIHNPADTLEYRGRAPFAENSSY